VFPGCAFIELWRFSVAVSVLLILQSATFRKLSLRTNQVSSEFFLKGFRMFRRNYLIPTLVLVHLLAGIVSAIFSDNEPAISSGILLSLVLSQVGLLGMWWGLGKTFWIIRLSGITAGILYLNVLLAVGIDEWREFIDFLILLAVATGIVALVTWLIRRFKAELSRVDSTQTGIKEGLQFTIRHLMSLTFLVALLLSGGKFLATYIDFRAIVVAMIVALAVCFAAVSVASLWATLSLGHPAFRVMIVFFIVMLTAICEIAMGYAGGNQETGLVWAGVTTFQAIIVLGTLSLFRLTGYRLVAKRRITKDDASSQTKPTLEK